MNCAYHAEVQNVAFCIRCGRALCGECVRNVRGSVYCEGCLGELVAGPPADAGRAAANGPVGSTAVVGGASPGAAFALGLIPGVGAIYNAEYFKAAAHLVIFGMLISITGNGFGPLEPLFALLTFGFYVYMPFEAYYTAKKKQFLKSGINLETPFDGIHQQLASIKQKDLWGGATLIGIGTLFLLSNFDILDIDRVFQLWPIVLIVVGIMLLKRFQSGRTE